MANEKISAMPAVVSILNADLLPVVQSGVNKSATRPTLLHAQSPDTMTLVHNSGCFIQLNPTGNLNISVPNGSTMFIVSSLAGITLDNLGNIIIAAGGAGIVQISYNDPNPGNWAGVPTDVLVAIQRLAAAVSQNGLNPIP